MARYGPPHLDLFEIAEEIEESPVVEKVYSNNGGFCVDHSDQTTFIFGPVGPESHNTDMPEDVEEVLILVEDGCVKFQDSKILFAERTKSDRLIQFLESVLAGETAFAEIGSDRGLELLAETGYIQGYTPVDLAELVAGWAVSSSTDAVLDITTGSGTLLEKAAETADSGILTGVEIHPVIARLARSRLRGFEGAEIIESDFFEWRVPGQGDLDSNFEEYGESRRFDAVVGNPPAGRLHRIAREKIEDIQEKYSYTGKNASAAFVSKALTHLKDGGHGAFIIPKQSVDDELLEVVTENCKIQRLVQLPVNIFHDPRSVEMVLMTLIKEEVSTDDRSTGVGKFNQPQLPENARGLLEQPLEDILQNRYDTYNSEIVKASHADLLEDNAGKILSDPPIYDIITSDEFTRFGDLEGVLSGSGVQSGNNRFYFFDETEKEESEIDDRFFKPLIKNPPDDIWRITRYDIDKYALDLGPYIEEIGGRVDREVSVSQVLEILEEDGYIPLVNYIEEEFEVRGSGEDLQFSYRGSLENPDIVIPKMFDDPRAYKVEVEGALFDSTLIGIQAGSEEQQNTLARLLNIPLYREFFQTFSNSMGVEWFRINFGQLRDIPVIEEALNRDVFDRMEPFFPPENDNDLVSLNQILIESSPVEEVEEVLRRYLASRDDYAWAWLMTLPEFKEFQQLVEEDEETAKEFVLDRFDEELLDEARDTFNNIDFFENRRNLLNDLLMEFEEQHYRGFLAGIVLQFEGVLTDLVTQTGGDIVDDATPTKFEMPGQSRKNKNLNELITQFFDGEFSSYLDKTVRNRRNEIAHGRVFEDSEKLSIHFFISFYALCNASLNQYVRLAGE